MDVYQTRVEAFQGKLRGQADLAFFPLSADMQYLTGVQRPFPNFGAVHHPGAWLEGVWLGVEGDPHITLTRMSSELSGVGGEVFGLTEILGDWDAPERLVKKVLAEIGAADRCRIAIGEATHGETVVALTRMFPDATWLSATEILARQRRIKSSEEIDVMRRAGEVTEAAFESTLKHLKHGVTELDIVSELDLQLRRQGALGPSFTTCLYCSGPQHPLIHGRPEVTLGRRLEAPVSILFDFGAAWQGYCYDFGRTVFFGEPDASMHTIHRLVMDAQAAGIAQLKVGVTAASADARARTVIQDGGYGQAFRHRLGHGIGLDVHEAPYLTSGDETLLAERMLFTVEPSIMQERGVSARVEDVVVVGVQGGVPLTRSHPELIVIS